VNKNVIENKTDLNRLFAPRSIAIIGASSDFGRIGGLPIRFLLDNHYQGAIYPVNPKYDEIAGMTCYPSLAEIPHEVDLALVSVPRKFVKDAFDQCARKEVPFAILFSAGYAEMGDEGKKEQEALFKLAQKANLRILGPNCIGFINTHGKVAATFISALFNGLPAPGAIGLVTQSGGMGNALLTRAADRAMGLSYFISSGNELNLKTADFVEHFIDDPNTRVIALFLEGLRDIQHFSAAAERAMACGKPIVAVKVGRSEAGQKATASHTGALAGSDRIYDGYFRQKGICRVNDVDDLLETAHLFATYAPPAGNRAAILSVSGGSGALLSDLMSDQGLVLPAPSESTCRRLTDITPQVTSITNPMDITTQFMNDTEAIARYLETFAQDKSYDLLIFSLTFSDKDRTLPVAQTIANLKDKLKKPIVVCWPVGETARPAFDCLEKAGVPLFFQQTNCAAAVGHFVRYGKYRNKFS
jgi:acetate---CoA ligase (ADP-forming)